MSYQAKANSLQKVAQRYTDFLAQFGKEIPGDLIPLMESIFAPNCEKILNGTTVTNTIKGLHDQIKNAKESKDGVGLWTVKKVGSFTTDPEKNEVAVHYEIPTQKQGTLVVAKWLTIDQKGLIQKIDEVFNKKTE